MKLFRRPAKNASGQAPLPADLRDDTLKFKVIIDNIDDGVILIDSQRIIQLMNPGAGKICGWMDEAVGLDVDSVIKLVNGKG
ncbi:MAG TPA: PAS domain-containing protein, partial [Verrucomicrobiae bacterium]|nr:PAS domain-containing protein [Verrucomicrobiae bacterium]